MVDANDKITKHKSKANDNTLEKNSSSKLHAPLVVYWACTEAEFSKENFHMDKRMEPWVDSERATAKARDILLAPR